jgi:hypothetical protein
MRFTENVPGVPQLPWQYVETTHHTDYSSCSAAGRTSTRIRQHLLAPAVDWPGLLEARVGIEPTHKGFADLSLTTWVPRLNLTL